MKKSLLFIVMVICFGIANSQVVCSKPNSSIQGRKHAINPNHIPTYVKGSQSKAPIPSGFARIVLNAGDIWGDGSGYQLLIDSDANAFGPIIPTSGPLNDYGDASSSVYAEFEYKIPTNADGALTTSHIVLNTSVSIDIPVGTIDWVVTNPTPGDRMWVVSNGRGDDLVLTSGFIYNFNVTGTPESGDVVGLNIVDPNLPKATVVWDFQDRSMPNLFTLYNDQNTIHTNNNYSLTDAWQVFSLDSLNYLAAACSWFSVAAQADRWMVTPKIALSTGNYIQFDAKSLNENYLESMEVRLSTTNNEKSAFTTLLWSDTSVSDILSTRTIDLSAYNGQDVYVAFVLNSTDKYIILVDNIKLLGQVSTIDTTNQIINTYIVADICHGDTYTLNGFNESITGHFTQNLQSINGYDSIVNLNLTVNPIPSIPSNLAINQMPNYFELTWQGDGENYNIYRDDTLIGNSSQSLFSDNNLVNGQSCCYKVKAFNGNCESELSDIVCKSYVGLEDIKSNNVSTKLYPNPSNEKAKLEFEGLSSEADVLVYDMLGRVVLSYKINQGDKDLEIDLTNHPKGVYTISIVNESVNRTKKLILQ